MNRNCQLSGGNTVSIKYKVLLPVLAALLLAATMMAWHSLSDARDMSHAEQAKILTAKFVGMEVGIASTAGEALAHASLFSRHPMVEDVYHKALEGKIDEGADPVVHGQRVRLREWSQDFLKGYSDVTGASQYKLHFHLPNSRSMLRAWRKTQSLSGKDESDDLSSFRETVNTINQPPHVPIQGIEVGRGGFAIRGLAPIQDAAGKHLGSVEMLYDFSKVTAALKDSPAQEMAIFMAAEQLDIATSLASKPDEHPLTGDFCLVSSTNKALTDKLVDEDLLNEGFKGLGEIHELDHFLLQAWPIRDFGGRSVGVMVFALDISDNLAALANARNDTLMIALLLMVITGGVLFYVVRSVTGPIQRLMSTAEAMTQGDAGDTINVDQDLLRSPDEIGNLARAFDTMLGSIRDTMKQLEERRAALAAKVDEALGTIESFAQGRLNVRMDTKEEDELHRLRIGFNEALEKLSVLINHLAGDADSLAQSSDGLQGVSASLMRQAESTSSQAGSAGRTAGSVNDSIQSVASATEEMEASIQEIAQNAGKAAQVASNARDTASDAEHIIQQLNESSREVEEVVKTISSISEQTNLLALNATIEAARAGDAGKGFAVVAGEVKDLARETNLATEDIAKRIAAIQRDTQKTITAIASISSVIQEIHQIETTIASAVEEQAATTQEISRSLGEAAGGSQEIVRHLEALSQAAEESSEFSRKTRSASDHLGDLAVAIRSRLDAFTI
jgi:methyl-accepting chemotaxis protein